MKQFDSDQWTWVGCQVATIVVYVFFLLLDYCKQRKLNKQLRDFTPASVQPQTQPIPHQDQNQEYLLPNQQ